MSEEYVIPNNFQHLRCIGVVVSCNFYRHNSEEDGKPYVQIQMLWPLVMLADIYANFGMYGRCYAKRVANAMNSQLCWQVVANGIPL